MVPRQEGATSQLQLHDIPSEFDKIFDISSLSYRGEQLAALNTLSQSDSQLPSEMDTFFSEDSKLIKLTVWNSNLFFRCLVHSTITYNQQLFTQVYCPFANLNTVKKFTDHFCYRTNNFVLSVGILMNPVILTAAIRHSFRTLI